jgi:lipopolysaccharide/colanic/teichoic acid biosynthesis glycosyltransferase
MTLPLQRHDTATRARDVPGYHISADSRAKRVVDVMVAVIVLVLASPAFVVIALLIALTSPGAIFFRQERVCLGGRRFLMLKFRTMRTNADESVHREYVLSMVRRTPDGAKRAGAFKLVGDSRVTRVGALLRKTSLDELPQFLHVLVGDMSVVGPRPPLPYEVEHYADWQMERLSARPGITGLWQVSGRNRHSYVEMCRLDVEYLQSWSIARDLWIVARTPWVMLRNSGRAG